MCSNCQDNICTNRCKPEPMRVFDIGETGFHMAIVEAAQALAKVKNQVRTSGDFFEFIRLLELQAEESTGYILTVPQPDGSLMYINRQHSETRVDTDAKLWFDFNKADQVAKQLDAVIQEL